MARPREFDVDQAIRVATEVFRVRGYQGASIDDLTSAMGILRGSLYRVFPDKRSLFVTVLDRYRTAQLDRIRIQLQQPSLEQLQAVLRELAENSSHCLLAALSREASGDAFVADRLSRHYQQLTEVVQDALESLAARGMLQGSGHDWNALATLFVAAAQGLGAFPVNRAAALDELFRLLTVESRTHGSFETRAVSA